MILLYLGVFYLVAQHNKYLLALWVGVLYYNRYSARCTVIVVNSIYCIIRQQHSEILVVMLTEIYEQVIFQFAVLNHFYKNHKFLV